MQRARPKLADQLIKKLSRAELRAILSEWISQQDFCQAMTGVADDDEAEVDES